MCLLKTGACLIHVFFNVFAFAGTEYMVQILVIYRCRASDFFQHWWAKETHGAKNGGSFSEMMGPSISN